ncbi:glutaminyl-peptide cyclotransferase [Psychrobium sp. 1_MG-2023]|uniref:glutaminyl-peptide cyclotransferase n=1 Tax=Psychrobium sp. 1_MG-2023 TaxID=3062624 RepID=UPI000C31C770|nr:glutaminyl-peptide cyclotransferase [Psychrobium sp. 1_MG-2023]MDP2560848.1 glutaminyl-peptide cyclotransferase [Psychrobium sp. 1_MG-2023]PKF56722.1 glutaminyl-peptide cyclotransferase [Alteromonadales bacterium alter-6D02]
MSSLARIKQAARQTYQQLWYFNIPIVTPQIIAVYPHDPRAFTQGLVFEQGCLYESTGLIGESTVRRLSFEHAIPELSHPLEDHWGEGIACNREQLIQLTWQSQIAMVYRLTDLQPITELPYQGEGWGLASIDDGFVMTDGSERLQFLNHHFEVVSDVRVMIKGKPLRWLNDLIFANGSLYINRLSDHFIYQVSPLSGQVERIIDCSYIVAIEQPSGNEDVLNGIAFNQQQQQFIITGKRWSQLFVVTF